MQHQSHARRYTEFFGTPVQLDVNPQISFSAIDALRPFLTVNESMWQVFEPDLRRRLNELDATATTTQRVQALLLELIPSNIATIDEVADRLAMSKRTLQRRLENEGENFRALLNETREKLARHYLKETSLSGGKIAFLLGFEDPNSFYRAFQDWTGQTPEHTRHNIHLN
jgi:Transcriptional regulator containing an amidase domain and an AraC-type DNA-binding HTH domain